MLEPALRLESLESEPPLPSPIVSIPVVWAPISPPERTVTVFDCLKVVWVILEPAWSWGPAILVVEMKGDVRLGIVVMLP